MSPLHAPTFGEKLVLHLLRELPSDDFYCYAEPRTDCPTEKSLYPDYVIVWRQRGVLCIEVKDWRNIVGGDGRNVKFDSGGQIKIASNPYETARDYALRLKEKLEQRRELLTRYNDSEQLAFPVEPLVILTHQDRTTLSWLQAVGILPPQNVMCSDDLVSVDTFGAALNHLKWTFRPVQILSQAQINVIQHTLKIVEVRVKTESQEIKRGTLTQEQDEIVWAPVPVKQNGISSTLVRGVVGSGKTIVLTKKADLLAELRPELNILITTFNIDLADDLKRRVQHPRVRVKKIFDIVREILGSEYPCIVQYRGSWDPKSNLAWCKQNAELFDLPPEFVSQEISRRKDLKLKSDEQYRNDLRKREADLTDTEIDDLATAYDLYIEYQQHLRQLGEGWQDYEDAVLMARNAIHGHKYHRYFDIIMLDEGQDFSPNMFELLRSMLKPGGYLFVCDDPMQSLWRQYDLADRGLRNADVKLLKLPLRTTREIAETAQSLFEMIPAIRTDDDHLIYPAQTDYLTSGGNPLLISFRNPQAEKAYVMRWVQDQLTTGNSPESIAVFTPHFHYDWLETLQQRNIYYGHFNRMKGLEFDTVYIASLDEVFQSPWNNRLITERWLYRKLFVAMTRARHRLIMSYSGELPSRLSPLQYYCDVCSPTDEK